MRTLILFIAMLISSTAMAAEHPNIVRLWAPGLIVQKADDGACYFSEDIYSSNGAIWIEAHSSNFLIALFKGINYDTQDPTIKRGQPISLSDLQNEQLKQMALSGYKIYSIYHYSPAPCLATTTLKRFTWASGMYVEWRIMAKSGVQ